MHFISNPKYKLNLPVDQMKRIYFIVIILLAVLSALTYLYFSKLNKDTHITDLSLSAATAQSGLIFCIQNNKSVTDLLSSQDLLQSLLSKDKQKTLLSLQSQFLNDPDLNKYLNGQNLYISFIAAGNKNTDLLISTQTNGQNDPATLKLLLKSKVLSLTDTADVSRLTTKDSLTFYLKQKDNLLLLSTSFKTISNNLKAEAGKTDQEFLDYIKTNLKLTSNSVASVYLNFNFQQNLLQQISPSGLDESLMLFQQQDAFACLSYNYSKEKILFTGNTFVKSDQNYLKLFSESKAGKITIDALLPENTANYTIYTISNYTEWGQQLHKRFTEFNKEKEIQTALSRIDTKYHLDLQRIIPEYFKDQAVTFQLSSGEKLGAINLKNGDKLSQLLLDISSNYSTEIKSFKEQDLLYYYFGDPFKGFKKPYYIIIDNAMIFANNASTLQDFLSNYSGNRLLINNKTYVNALDQLPNTSTILFYLGKKKQENTEKFDTFIYQLSADHKNFQTNTLLFNNSTP